MICNPSLLRLAGLALLSLPFAAQSASYDEILNGEISGNRLAPSLFLLDYGQTGTNGLAGNNILTGRVGRINGAVDRDYLHIVVPDGYVWTELRVGNQTTVGVNSSFIGLAAGEIMPVAETASTAAGLLGYRLYGTADRGQNILDDMALGGNGASGFGTPLAAGSYTLWIQELATGDFNYRFNLLLAPVPEPESYAMLLAGLGLIGAMTRRRQQKQAASFAACREA